MSERALQERAARLQELRDRVKSLSAQLDELDSTSVDPDAMSNDAFEAYCLKQFKVRQEYATARLEYDRERDLFIDHLLVLIRASK